MQKFMTIIIFICTIAACSKGRPIGDEDGNIVEIKDTLIVSIIDQYIKAYELDPFRTVIDLSYSLSDKEILYLTYIKVYPDEVALPSFYTVVNQHLVFLKSDIDHITARKKNNRKLAELLDDKGITLEKFKGTTFHAPIWKVERCSSKVTIYKEKIPAYFDYLPCGYRIEFDTSDVDKLNLVKTIEE
jgi:hypothetical protein